MTTEKQDYRLKIKDVMGNTSFIARRGVKISYVGGDETPLALANVARDSATELRFALEDAENGSEAAKAVRKMAQFAKLVEVL